MSETARPDIAIREASATDAARLSLVANATFLETFAGLIDGEALVVPHRLGGSRFGLGHLARRQQQQTS